MSEFNEALEEIIGVAESIAKQTSTHLERVHTSWSTTSEFRRIWYSDSLHVGRYTYDDITIDTDDLVYDEAIEFAWSAEAAWNECAPMWRKAEAEAIDGDYDEYSAMVHSIDADVDNTLEGIAAILEDWIDSAAEYYDDEEVA